MEILSTYRFARISAFKAREVTREIQGLPVGLALDLVAFSPKKAAALVAKTLKSAVANAENNNNLRAEQLVVKEAVVGEAPTLKRFQPKARGSAGPIRKRTSHIRIVLTDETDTPLPAKRRRHLSREARESAARPGESRARRAGRAPQAGQPAGENPADPAAQTETKE